MDRGEGGSGREVGKGGQGGGEREKKRRGGGRGRNAEAAQTLLQLLLITTVPGTERETNQGSHYPL